MKKALYYFVSPEQLGLGFVPNRIIGESTHLSKLIQAYLEDSNEEGIILALDWEKAFDRCSWTYLHKALTALNFGPRFSHFIFLLSNVEAPPTRRIKTYGE
jgi:hypothetical protein